MSHSTVPGAAGAANPSRASTFAAVLSGLPLAERTGKVRIWVTTNRGASAQATW